MLKCLKFILKPSERNYQTLGVESKLIIVDKVKTQQISNKRFIEILIHSYLLKGNVMKKVISMFFVCFLIFSSSLALGWEWENSYAQLFCPGEKKGLSEKLVVTTPDAFLFKEIGGRGEQLSPLTILWRLKIEDAEDETNPVKTVGDKSYYRVGGPDGSELGWVETTKVTSWMTRFVLAPLSPRQNDVFCVFDRPYTVEEFGEANPEELEEDMIAKLDRLPQSGCGAYAFVLSKDDKHEVRNDSKGIAVIPREEALEAIDLDPESFKKVFIYAGPTGARSEAVNEIKSEDVGADVVFVIDTTDSMRSMIDMVKEVCGEIAKGVQSDESLKGKVHFGLVEYRDSESKHEQDSFGARVVCDLDASYDEFLEALNGLTLGHGGDYPEEVLLGLRTAVDEIHWNTSSSKHIVLLGDAPNKGTAKTGELDTFKKLFDYANEDVGMDDRSKALNQKWFHAILGRGTKEAQKKWEIQAEKEWNEITQNQFRGQGILNFLYERELTSNFVNDLRLTIEAALDRLGDEMPDSRMADKVWALKKALREDGETPANQQYGYASALSQEGGLVAEMKAMVLHEELERLHASLKSTHTDLRRYYAQGKGNLKIILDDLLEELTGAVAGENAEYYDRNIMEIIGEQLPVHTPALTINLRDVQRMTTEKFEEWLDDIQKSVERAKNLLDSKEAWIKINSGEDSEQSYAFISVNDLP